MKSLTQMPMGRKLSGKMEALSAPKFLQFLGVKHVFILESTIHSFRFCWVYSSCIWSTQRFYICLEIYEQMSVKGWALITDAMTTPQAFVIFLYGTDWEFNNMFLNRSANSSKISTRRSGGDTDM